MRLGLFLVTSVMWAQSWQMQDSGVTASLRGVSAVSDRVAWASGAAGTILRTVDGEHWAKVSPTGVADLDFRDIEAQSDRVAVVMAAGEGRASRLYKTTDGGATWALLRANGPEGFWDSFAMWDGTHGVLLGDPVNGRFTILTTNDGVTWLEQQGPKADPGEAAFAASGTALIARGTREAWFATNAGRIFHSEDAGKSWTVERTPLKPAGDGAGIFSLAAAGRVMVAVGGDYTKPGDTADNIVVHSGKWSVPTGAPAGYRSAVARVADKWIAVGPTGSDVSDDAQSWRTFDTGAFHAVSSFWAVGPAGRIARLLF